MKALLWIAGTGSRWRDLPAMFSNWSTPYRRFGDWRKANFLSGFSILCRMSPTWNTRCLTPQSSKSTDKVSAQRGAQSQTVAPFKGGTTTKVWP